MIVLELFAPNSESVDGRRCQIVSKSRNPARRESRKPRKPLPTLEELKFPDSPRISRPKKSDRQALKRISRGYYFWDEKKIVRAATRRENKNLSELGHAGVKKHHLPKPVREGMLKLMPSWEYDTNSKAFRAVSGNGATNISRQHMAELIEAVTTMPQSPASLKIWNLHFEDMRELRKILPSGSVIQSLKSNWRTAKENDNQPEKVITSTMTTYLNKAGGLEDGL